MRRNRRGLTYRVRQLPSFLEINQVAEFIITACKKLGSAQAIRVFSLASSLSQYETVPTKTATLVFIQIPELFDNDQEQWPIPSEHPKWRRQLIFDIHFLGLTPLNDRIIDEDAFDSIAISGLASHAFGSWKQRGDSNFMWLRDKSPQDMPNCRSIIYGYDTALVRSQSFQNIDDLALKFVSKLRSINPLGVPPTPFVLFAHSLGGIILKRAITLIANSCRSQIDDLILRSIRMIYFFGVPNQGMKASHLLTMVKGQSNETLVENLSTGSDYLSNLDIQFSGLSCLRSTILISLYETKRSPTAKEIRSGHWERGEPYEILVDRNSAIQRGTTPSHMIPIDEDHSNMVKFSEDDVTYQDVQQLLGELKSTFDEQTPLRDKIFSGEDTGHRSSRVHPKELIDAMVKSLDHEEAEFRREQIERNYSHTFKWIFGDQKLCFAQWLQDDTSIYWIRGKPGSGKSTLMKFLSTSEKTKKYLSHSNPEVVTTCGWYFFYNRGSLFQKSLDGLQRSVLHQILTAETPHKRQLAELVLPVYIERNKNKQLLWPHRDLKRAFDLLIGQELFPLRLYLFLDALDEYDGRPELVADFLESVIETSWRSKTRVKICFSSRPWNIFVDRFDSFPGFSMQDQTEQDIWRYVEEKIQNDESMKRLFTSRCDSIKLISPIVKRSQGVFLWVRLLVDELSTARSDSADLPELLEILLDIPAELEDYYDRIIDRIPQRYRLESYIMMEILVRTGRQLTLLEFACAVEVALCETVGECLQKMKPGLLWQKDCVEAKRRLQSRCGGLVELVGSKRVQFMHQTVKDFIASPGLEQRVLGQHCSAPFQNGHSFLTKCYLTLQSRTSTASQSRLMGAISHSHLAESTLGVSQRKFLDSVSDAAVTTEGRGGLEINSVMSFGVVADLRLYISEKADCINLNKEITLLHLVAKNAALERDLLSEALQNEALESQAMRASKSRSLDLMCDLLLSLGADKEAEVCHTTPFQCLFEDYLWNRLDLRVPENRFLDVAHSFLKHGQNTNIGINSVNSLHMPVGLHCKPLHFSHGALAGVLVEHGADVNALSSRGWTALDFSAWYVHQMGICDRPRLEAEFRSALLLLRNGGCITRHGELYWKGFADALESHFVLPNKFRDPPRLG